MLLCIPTSRICEFLLLHVFISTRYCYYNFRSSSGGRVTPLWLFLVFVFCFVFEPYFEVTSDLQNCCKDGTESSFMPFAQHPLMQWFSTRGDLAPVDTWQYIETFLIVTSWGGGSQGAATDT